MSEAEDEAPIAADEGEQAEDEAPIAADEGGQAEDEAPIAAAEPAEGERGSGRGAHGATARALNFELGILDISHFMLYLINNKILFGLCVEKI